MSRKQKAESRIENFFVFFLGVLFGNFLLFSVFFSDFFSFVFFRSYFGFFNIFFSFLLFGYFTKSRNACGKEVLDCVGVHVLAQGRHESSRTDEELIRARAIMPKALKYTKRGADVPPCAAD